MLFRYPYSEQDIRAWTVDENPGSATSGSVICADERGRLLKDGCGGTGGNPSAFLGCWSPFMEVPGLSFLHHCGWVGCGWSPVV
jgi:hypothetical protein